MNTTTKAIPAFCVAIFCATSLARIPEVKLVSATQNHRTSAVVCVYSNDIPAIVTFDVLTNGVSIGGRNLRYCVGDVNKYVPAGEHSLTWRPDKAWPGQKITDGSVQFAVTAWATNAPPDYMALDLEINGRITFYPSEGALPYDVTNNVYRTSQMLFRKCPAAGVTWRIGSPVTEDKRVAARESPHSVSFTEDYYIGVYPLTQGQYKHVNAHRTVSVTYTSNYADSPDSPLYPFCGLNMNDIRGRISEGINWHAGNQSLTVTSESICGLLRTMGANAVDFDIPTEAQWEYACRAGEGAAYSNGSNSDMSDLGWYDGNSDGVPHPVGMKKSNAWGIYDMHGLVSEWCRDWRFWAYETLEQTIDPPGSSEAQSKTEMGMNDVFRIMRGGSFRDDKQICRSARRNYGNGEGGRENFYGVRLWAPAIYHP